MAREPLSEADKRRLERDNKTVVAMAKIYCHDHHRGALRNEQGLCAECAPIIEYAIARTKACPRKHKGTCDTCTIQCYKPEMREKIRAIMAYSGPRMMLHHPIMAIRHVYKKAKGHPKEDE